MELRAHHCSLPVVQSVSVCLFRDAVGCGRERTIKGATFVLEIITNNCHYILSCYFTVIVPEGIEKK